MGAMATSARLRLYQYPLSPYCISVALLLKHSGDSASKWSISRMEIRAR